MIRSMTAFARQDQRSQDGTVSWEIRSVNHRYLEVYARLPEDYRSLEGPVRELVSKYLDRGKVELNMQFKPSAETLTGLVFNKALADEVVAICHQLSSSSADVNSVSAMEVLKWPGVMEVPSPDTERVTKQAMELLTLAIKELVESREREGEKLQQALEERRVKMAEIVALLRTQVSNIVEAVRSRMIKRFEELSVNVDEGRLEQELVYLAQRTDVEEELKRLETHIQELERLINPKEYKPAGRRLDFLMQELNREANTLCSKSMDAETTKHGIELKVLIEQMREQVQNIE